MARTLARHRDHELPSLDLSIEWRGGEGGWIHGEGLGVAGSTHYGAATGDEVTGFPIRVPPTAMEGGNWLQCHGHR